MVYAIYEGNMERVRKKMTRIQNKCRKFGCDFLFNEIGEEFREFDGDDGEKVIRRFVIVEAEGHAKVNGWQFIGTVDHTEKGNIISKAVDVEVPERYYTSRPFCEHCGTDRYRKSTYIVMNDDGEFKQVGKSCLMDFTGGMKAEWVAAYASAFDDLIEAEDPHGGSGYAPRYMRTETWARFVAETIRHYGYVKSSEVDSTDTKANHFYDFHHHIMLVYSDLWYDTRNEIERVGFNPDSPEAIKMAEEALAWIAEQDEYNNFMHNLKTACALEYIPSGMTALVASVFPTWRKDLERKAIREAEKASEWQGSVGERITATIADYRVVTGWETEWGYTVIYKITDTNGNVYTWKTSATIPETAKTITGTVKEHKEYNGVKQTELTRCKCK